MQTYKEIEKEQAGFLIQEVDSRIAIVEKIKARNDFPADRHVILDTTISALKAIRNLIDDWRNTR